MGVLRDRHHATGSYLMQCRCGLSNIMHGRTISGATFSGHTDQEAIVDSVPGGTITCVCVCVCVRACGVHACVRARAVVYIV